MVATCRHLEGRSSTGAVVMCVRILVGMLVRTLEYKLVTGVCVVILASSASTKLRIALCDLDIN